MPSSPRAYVAILLLPACWLLLASDGEPDRARPLVADGIGEHRTTHRRDAGGEGRSGGASRTGLHLLAGVGSVGAKQPGNSGRQDLCSVVFGAVEGVYGETSFSNVAAVIGADGRLLGVFPKQRPVPLMLDGAPGETRPVFPMEEGVLGVAICYDFDAPPTANALVRSGATVLIAPTLDAMGWGRGSTNTMPCCSGCVRSKRTAGWCGPRHRADRK